MSDIRIDDVVAAFVNTRDEIAALELELAEKIKPLKAVQDRRQSYLLAKLNESGAQNMKTSFGTAYVNTRESVTVGDWAAFVDNCLINPVVQRVIDFVYAGGEVASSLREQLTDAVAEALQIELLEKRVSKTAALEIMGDKRDNPPPPGVNYVAVREALVRRA